MVDHAGIRALGELARTRRGLFSTAAAAGIGIDVRSLIHLEERGWLRRVRRGAWALAGAPGDRWEPLVAASVVMGPGAVLSHWSAAAIHGFDGTRIGAPELTVDAGSRRRLEGVRIHRTGPVPSDEIVIRRGVAVTTPARTMVDLAASASEQRLGELLDGGVVRRLFTPAEVGSVLDAQARRRPGAPLLRGLLDVRKDVGDSHLEQQILRSLDPLRPFETHYQIVLDGRVYVVDVAWPWCRVAAEIDGRTYRTTSRSAFERETRKLNELGNADWLVAHLSAGMSAATCRRAVTDYMALRGVPVSLAR